MFGGWGRHRFVSSKTPAMNTNLKTASDNELIDLFKRRPSGFGELYDVQVTKRFTTVAAKFAKMKMCIWFKSEVMLKAFDHLNEFRGNSLFKTWILYHRQSPLFSHLHKAKPGQALTENLSDTLADEHDDDQHAMMLTLINRLPEEEKNFCSANTKQASPSKT